MIGGRRGFTLIEVTVAVLLLAVVALGLGGATARLSRVAATSGSQAAALDLVDQRVAWIQMDPAYDSLEVRYARVEGGLSALPGAMRETRIVRTRQRLPTGKFLDYKQVTVTVQPAPGMGRTVSRTITVGAP